MYDRMIIQCLDFLVHFQNSYFFSELIHIFGLIGFEKQHTNIVLPLQVQKFIFKTRKLKKTTIKHSDRNAEEARNYETFSYFDGTSYRIRLSTSKKIFYPVVCFLLKQLLYFLCFFSPRHTIVRL